VINFDAKNERRASVRNIIFGASLVCIESIDI